MEGTVPGIKIYLRGKTVSEFNSKHSSHIRIRIKRKMRTILVHLRELTERKLTDRRSHELKRQTDGLTPLLKGVKTNRQIEKTNKCH